MDGPSARFWTAFGAITAIALVAICTVRKGLFSEETAAWAQALGTVAAIWGAAWIANRQSKEAVEREAASHSRAEAARRKAAADDRAAAGMLADYSVSAISIIRKKLEEGDTLLVYRAAQLIDLPGQPELRELQRFPLELLRDEDAARSFLGLREQVRCYVDTMRLLCQQALPEEHTQKCFQILDQYIDTAQNYARTLDARLDALR